jgi:hypothetical protein
MECLAAVPRHLGKDLPQQVHIEGIGCSLDLEKCSETGSLVAPPIVDRQHFKLFNPAQALKCLSLDFVKREQHGCLAAQRHAAPTLNQAHYTHPKAQPPPMVTLFPTPAAGKTA